MERGLGTFTTATGRAWRGDGVILFVHAMQVLVFSVSMQIATCHVTALRVSFLSVLKKFKLSKQRVSCQQQQHQQRTKRGFCPTPHSLSHFRSLGRGRARRKQWSCSFCNCFTLSSSAYGNRKQVHVSDPSRGA